MLKYSDVEEKNNCLVYEIYRRGNIGKLRTAEAYINMKDGDELFTRVYIGIIDDTIRDIRKNTGKEVDIKHDWSRLYVELHDDMTKSYMQICKDALKSAGDTIIDLYTGYLKQHGHIENCIGW